MNQEVIGMVTLATAFALAWASVAFYGMWLGLEQHRLRQRLDALETLDELDGEEEPGLPRSRAA